MSCTRRDLALMLPALAAAQTSPPAGALSSKAFRFEDLPVRKSGAGASRQILTGNTHTGYRIDIHATEVPAGEVPHAPHHHVHEEMLLIREGELEVTVKGVTSRLGPGSVLYVASNEEHGWRNVGKTTAHYWVLALGEDQ